MKKVAILILILMLGGFSAYLEACRIVPSPPRPPAPSTLSPITVKSHNFDVKIKDGVAVTTLESIFYNPNPNILEGTYLFPLPEGASISKFSMWIDGKEQQGELLDATKARDLYISIVQRMIDPGLLEFVGRQTFKMRIFPIPANGEKRIKLTYTQVLPMEGNLISYIYPLTTVGNGREDNIKDLSFTISISSKIPINSVFSPTHNIQVSRKDDNDVKVSYEGSNVKPDRDVVLYISHSNKKIDLSMVSFKDKEKEGYFLLLLSPQVTLDKKDILPKEVVFVCDTSGSMAGDKIEQAKRALKYCINSLNSDDLFNLILFSTEANPYKEKLVKATKENINQVISYIDEEMIARGGTCIDEALTTALNMTSKDTSKPFMVVFMTDGKPTIGERNTQVILKNVEKNRPNTLRLFTFGIGEDLDTQLLDELANKNHGSRDYVTPKEDIELKVSNFFTKVSSPVLTSPKIVFPDTEGLKIRELYPKELPDLFRGMQLSIMGRYTGSGDQVIRLEGMVQTEKKEYVFETSFPNESDENPQIPRVWASRKIGYLLDQIRLHGETPEVKEEVVRLAKKFGIITPYTSYLVLEDNAVAQTPVTQALRDRMVEEERNLAPSAPSARKEMSGAYDGMKSKAGGESVKASIAADKLKKADSDEAGGKTLLSSVIKKIDDKTFYLKDGVWYDSDYDGKASPVKIKYLSNEYINLLKEKPKIGKYLSIGKKVVVIFDDKVYEIVE